MEVKFLKKYGTPHWNYFPATTERLKGQKKKEGRPAPYDPETKSFISATGEKIPEFIPETPAPAPSVEDGNSLPDPEERFCLQ